MAESFFATIECELLRRTPFGTREEAATGIFRFLEGCYNPQRRHSALGHLTPDEFERAWEAAQPVPARAGSPAIPGTPARRTALPADRGSDGDAGGSQPHKR